jgi:transcriptional regulator
VTDAPADYVDRMVSALIGLEIPITRLVGKWKVSQNRSPADRQGVIDGLLRDGAEGAVRVADLVRAAHDNRGN